MNTKHTQSRQTFIVLTHRIALSERPTMHVVGKVKAMRIALLIARNKFRARQQLNNTSHYLRINLGYVRLMYCTPEFIPVQCIRLNVIDVVILDDDSHVLLKLVTFKKCHVRRFKVEKLVLRSTCIREAVCQG